MSERLKFKFRFTFCIIKLLKKLGVPKNRCDFNPEHKKILIVSNTGIGDSMWGTPALKMIRKKYPKSHITILTSSLSSQVFLNNPDFNEIITLKKGGGLPLFVRFFSFYRKRFDTILIFHSSYKWIIPFCYFLSPNQLIGFKHDAKMFEGLLTEVLEAKLNHPIIQRLMLAKKIGVDEEEHQIQIYLNENEQKKADEFLSQFALDPQKALIGLQPGASDTFKCWPIQQFVELAKKISKELSAHIIIFGNKNEIYLADAIKKEVVAITAAGQIPLRISMALIKKMDVFVTNDTGPLHLAIAQKVPLVTIFGPTPHHLCWPHLENPIVRILAKPIPCFNCVGRKCFLPYCLEQIKVEDVFHHVKDLLSLKKNDSIYKVHEEKIEA